MKDIREITSKDPTQRYSAWTRPGSGTQVQKSAVDVRVYAKRYSQTDDEKGTNYTTMASPGFLSARNPTKGSLTSLVDSSKWV